MDKTVFFSGLKCIIIIIASFFGYHYAICQNFTTYVPLYKEIYPTIGNDTVPPYNFTAIIGCTIGNTFSNTLILNNNITIPISIESNVSCNVYFFFKERPDLFSISFDTDSLINNKYHGQTTITTPFRGEYILLATSKINEGKCDITIGPYSFLNKDVAHNTFSVQLGGNETYNFFTSQSTHNLKLCVLNGLQPGTIKAYNDNYVGSSGEFNWGNEARIINQFTDSINGIIVFANYDSSPFAQQMIRTTDLYMGCLTTNNLLNDFANLNQNDAIMTAPSSTAYNCHAWACGLWNIWHDPAFPYSIINATLAQRLARFDYDYNNRGYTRENATENNSVIDLWVYNDNITHSSIKSKTNNNSVSYSWESKAGSNCRFMHPRYSLESYTGPQYGQVMYHYKKINGDEPSIPIYENIYFSPHEQEWINMQVSSLPLSAKHNFDLIYNIIEHSFTNTISSNLKSITESASFIELDRYIKKYPNLIYYAMTLLDKGSYVAACLIVKNTITENNDLLNKFWPLQYDSKPDKEETILSNTLKYSKAIIAKAMKKDINYALQDSIVSGNSPQNFNITIHQSGFSINIDIKKESHVSIDLASDKGQLIKRIQNGNLDKGRYQFNSSTLLKGAYIVYITINGRIYTQKILITN